MLVLTNFDDPDFGRTVKYLERQCCLHEHWGVYVSWNPDDGFEEVYRACPILAVVNPDNFEHGHGAILAPTEGEVRALFGLVVGDDGPTRLNPYKGPAKVYALMVNNHGKAVTENT